MDMDNNDLLEGGSMFAVFNPDAEDAQANFVTYFIAVRALNNKHKTSNSSLKKTFTLTLRTSYFISLGRTADSIKKCIECCQLASIGFQGHIEAFPNQWFRKNPR